MDNGEAGFASSVAAVTHLLFAVFAGLFDPTTRHVGFSVAVLYARPRVGGWWVVYLTRGQGVEEPQRGQDEGWRRNMMKVRWS